MSATVAEMPAAADLLLDQAAQSMGAFLTAATVLCEDCSWIGLPLNGRCRKCAGGSISALLPIVRPEGSHRESDSDGGLLR